MPSNSPEQPHPFPNSDRVDTDKTSDYFRRINHDHPTASLGATAFEAIGGYEPGRQPTQSQEKDEIRRLVALKEHRDAKSHQ